MNMYGRDNKRTTFELRPFCVQHLLVSLASLLLLFSLLWLLAVLLLLLLLLLQFAIFIKLFPFLGLWTTH